MKIKIFFKDGENYIQYKYQKNCYWINGMFLHIKENKRHYMYNIDTIDSVIIDKG